MNERKYCRLRHATTKNEVQVAADYVDGVLTIRHFYAQAKDGLFHEINRQHCHDEEVFGAMWDDTIKAYEKRGWEIMEQRTAAKMQLHRTIKKGGEECHG